jgi:hypothetical protein
MRCREIVYSERVVTVSIQAIAISLAAAIIIAGSA